MTAWASTRPTFLAVLFVGLFGMAARNVSDPDVWWHFKTGQLIVESHTVPRTDPFSYTRAGQPWVAHEWLSDVLLYELQRSAGWGTLIVAFAAIICAAFFLLFLRCGRNSYVAGVLTLWAALATRPLWGVRPQMLSLFLTSLWLLILERSESKPKLLWWTLPLTVLWVNLHGGFALGIGLSALFLFGEGIKHFFGRIANTARLRGLGLNLALDLLLVWLNPNGIKLYSYPIVTLRSSAMQTYIAEWASPNFHRAEYWPFLSIFLVVLALILWARFEVRARDLLLLIVSLAAALRSIRLIPIFVLIAVPIAARLIQRWIQEGRVEQQDRTRLPATTGYALNGIVGLSFLFFVALHTIHIIRLQPKAEAQNFPLRAISFLQTHSIPGNILNHYDWGGYLIWKLYPSRRVFVDGRADVYGEEFFSQYADTYQFKNDWRQNLDRREIESVLVPPDSALAAGLEQNAEWQPVYEDNQAVILRRQRSRNIARNPSVITARR
jgi:hypothetical protein